MQALLGVIIVTYNSTDVILDCLETLLGAANADNVKLHIVVVDNASTDDTCNVILDWASGEIPYTPAPNLPFKHLPVGKPLDLENPTLGNSIAPLTLIPTGVNRGFAGGVNIGLTNLAMITQINRIWVLNPDSAVPPGTVGALVDYDPGPFSLMGGRIIYFDNPDKIQIDGGLISQYTGITYNKSQYGPLDTVSPSPHELDFISGASMVISRAFYDIAGPMPEDYFLYYEEVDWAQKRKNLPLAYCPEVIIYHRAGTAIGSPTLNRPASPFSLYFKHRARMRFMRRYYPTRLPIAFAYSCAKAIQLAFKGYRREAWTLMLASLNRPPPEHVRGMLSDEAAQVAFPEHATKM